MSNTRRARTLAVATALALGLTGCSLLTPSTLEKPLTGSAACALGHTWSLDLKKLSSQVLAELQKNETGATAVDSAGSQTMTWDRASSVAIDSDYSLTVTASTAPKQIYTITQTHRGTASGRAYISADVAIPRNWEAKDFIVKTVVKLNGSTVKEVPFVMSSTDLDDAVGIEITCDGKTLTTHPRGSAVTQTWSRTD
jgi:hypothetical protein